MHCLIWRAWGGVRWVQEEVITSGTAIRPPHMLVRPPWKAILNMVFLARLKGKIDLGCYWSFGLVV